MAVTHAMWIHGHNVVIEYPERLQSVWRAGSFTQVIGKPGTENWFHFAVPTPAVVDDTRLRAGSVTFRFRTRSADAFVSAVHVFDGENRLAVHDGFRLSATQWEWPRFIVPGNREIWWGLGISLGVGFGMENQPHVMELAAAGCELHK